jgi:murein DD-endopeptidase MepM/ murein hydrolase activator NlpD
VESIRRFGQEARGRAAGLLALVTAVFVGTAVLAAEASSPGLPEPAMHAAEATSPRFPDPVLLAAEATSPGFAAAGPRATFPASAEPWGAEPEPPDPAFPPSRTAWPLVADPRTTPQPRLSWPLSPVPVVTKYFDAPETPYGPGHRGVDLATVPGQEVLAADAGVVVFAGLVGGRPVISVDHDGGLRTTYEPVSPKVAAGDQVFRGQVLGTVLAGHPGCAIAACLHWGVRRGEEYVDPLSLTGEAGEYRLKPWGGGP